jgi:hypothetical protein
MIVFLLQKGLKELSYIYIKEERQELQKQTNKQTNKYNELQDCPCQELQS